MNFLTKFKKADTPKYVRDLRQAVAAGEALSELTLPFSHHIGKGSEELDAALASFDKEPTLENSNVVLAAVEEKALKNATVEIAMPARSSMMETIRRENLAILKPALKAALKGKIADMESEAKALTDSYRKQASELGVDVAVLAGPLVGRINEAVNEAQSHLERAKSWTSASNARSAIDLCLR